MTVEIRIKVPKEINDLYIGDALDKAIFREEALIYQKAFVRAGLIGAQEVLDFIVNGDPEIPINSIRVFLKGTIIDIEFEAKENQN